MEALLNEDIANQVKEAFSQLEHPVEMLFFGEQENCEYCDQTLQLVKEVSDLSDQIHLSQFDIHNDAELAERYNVDKTPGLVIASREEDQLVDYGVRFAGIPAGPHQGHQPGFSQSPHRQPAGVLQYRQHSRNNCRPD